MFELHLLCPEESVEIIGDALTELDALSISVEDADANTDAERALFGEPGMVNAHAAWVRSRVVALFASEEQARHAASLLSLQDFFASCRLVSVSPVPEQDWVRITQSQFAPVPVTPDFYIVPTWCEAPSEAKQIIRLDPGLAFGTGTHPTTHMCLKWIATQAGAGLALGRTLDYGCGSGILAIAAKKYGAAAVDAVDIDPAAVTASKANASANLSTLSIDADMSIGLPDLAQGLYNTVLANILASPLKVLAPLLSGHVATGGHLVLAGILERQTDELKAAYAPYIQLEVSDTSDGWVLMTGQLA
jgi:ribosomal protein L11 methyltransferase